MSTRVPSHSTRSILTSISVSKWQSVQTSKRGNMKQRSEGNKTEQWDDLAACGARGMREDKQGLIIKKAAQTQGARKINKIKCGNSGGLRLGMQKQNDKKG